MSDEITWLREVFEAATPGEWEHHGANAWVAGDSIGYVVMADSGLPDVTHAQDATAIALAHNVGAELLAVVEAAAEQREAIRGMEAHRPSDGEEMYVFHLARMRRAEAALHAALDALCAKVRAERGA